MGEMSDSVVACRDGAGCDALLHSALEGSARVDTSGRIAVVDGRAEEWLGWARSTR